MKNKLLSLFVIVLSVRIVQAAQPDQRRLQLIDGMLTEIYQKPADLELSLIGPQELQSRFSEQESALIQLAAAGIFDPLKLIMLGCDQEPLEENQPLVTDQEIQNLKSEMDAQLEHIRQLQKQKKEKILAGDFDQVEQLKSNIALQLAAVKLNLEEYKKLLKIWDKQASARIEKETEKRLQKISEKYANNVEKRQAELRAWCQQNMKQ